MNFGDAIKSCLAQYTTFRGRAARSEFWFFFLFMILVYIIASIFDRVLGTSFSFRNPATGLTQNMGYGYIYTLAALALFLPNISVMVRRLHDTGHSGWWYWIILVPLVGAILLLVWFCSAGTASDNEYGSNPLAGNLAQTFS
jgi:uncharacterized membrane protein YhaH (DUF805 family)